jgi:hypothetical protein
VIDIKLTDLDKVLGAFDSKLLDRAVVNTINKTSAKAKTKVSKEVRETWNIKAKDFNRHAKLIRARYQRGRPEALLLYTGRKFGLINFSPKEKANRSVTVRVLKKKGRRPAISKNGMPGFIASTNGTRNIFARRGKKRFPIDRLQVKSAAEMIHPAVIREMNKQIEKDYPRIFEREYSFLQERAAR